MTGRQNIPANANALNPVAPIQANARDTVDTAKIVDMNSTSGDLKSRKKKHTNTTSIIVGIIGCSIIGYIIYNLLVFTY